jgi:hypothetical protein
MRGSCGDVVRGWKTEGREEMEARRLRGKDLARGGFRGGGCGENSLKDAYHV